MSNFLPPSIVRRLGLDPLGEGDTSRAQLKGPMLIEELHLNVPEYRHQCAQKAKHDGPKVRVAYLFIDGYTKKG